MRSILFRGLSSLALGLPLACGAASSDGQDGPGHDGFFDSDGNAGSLRAAQSFVAFPGGGSSGAAQPLTAALAPDTSDDCNPQASPGGSNAAVQTVCFFSADAPGVPAASIEQVVEIVGTSEWVHLRLTLNPDFVDNTYADTAIGWGEAADDGAGPQPPADGPRPPRADGAAPPPRGDRPEPGGERPPRPDAGGTADGPGADGPGAGGPGAGGPGGGPGADGGMARSAPGKRGHTFRDLVGSDHAEIELLDGDADVAVHFRIDYVSQSASAPSGYASLGVSGGEGRIILGEPEWFLATATSIDRNLNACGLGSFLESSPETDAAYTPNPAATAWDYRVAYEVWVSTDAFGDAGFGSALIDNVHASPSKADGDTADVLPAPCPVDPANPDAVPQPLPVVLQEIR